MPLTPPQMDKMVDDHFAFEGCDDVVKDVLQLDDADARKVKRWTIRGLVEAARKPIAHD